MRFPITPAALVRVFDPLRRGPRLGVARDGPVPEDVPEAVAEAIAETGATSAKDIGRVMPAAMKRLAGKTVDGKAVNAEVRGKLS